MEKIRVIDYTLGKRDSKDVNTNVPFTANYAVERTLQGANVVIANYVNKLDKIYTSIRDDQDVINNNMINLGEKVDQFEDEVDVNMLNITNLTNRVNVIEDEVDLNTDNIELINDEISGIETSIDNIDGNINTINYQITNIDNLLKEKLPVTEVKDGEDIIGYEIIKPLYIGENGNIIETSGQSQFYNNPIVNSLEPINDNELVNKGYVDSEISSLPVIYNGTSEPSNTLGKDGDLYFRTT